MRNFLGKAFCVIFGILIAFGFLRLCIDFVTWWNTPRFSEWSERGRVFFLFAWIVLSATASIFCFVVKEEIEDDF